MNIREATNTDWDAIYPIFHEIVSCGETYAFDNNLSKEEAFHLWMQLPRTTFVVEEDNVIYGSYYIKANFSGGGSHVCNCGYMVASNARGKGLATAMCQHSKKIAVQYGFKAMQFNAVVSTNQGAVRLWQKLGFDIVGHIPKAFHHPTQGYVDTFVMYQWLEQ